MKNKSFLAFNLGTTSGHTILGKVESGRLQMKEITRFSNQILQIGNHIHWNIYSLFEHLKAGRRATNQIVPSNDAEFVRCIFESLSLKYNYVLEKLKDLAPFPIDRLHVIGGGLKNPLLNQWTANATGIKIISGPSEAMAIGNIMIQAKSAGCVSSLQEMRQIIANSVQLDEFTPEDSIVWYEAYQKFLSITQLKKEPFALHI